MSDSVTGEGAVPPRVDELRTAESIHHVIGVVDRLGGRVINLLGWVLFLTFFAFAVFTGGYYYVLFEIDIKDPRRASALDAIQKIVLAVWDKILPIGETALRVIAPVIVLLLATGLLLVLARRGANPFDFSKVVTDLPSLIALLIVITICLLPLSGLPVPDVLNNVALVVVGFYFGKKLSTGADPHTG